MISVAVTKRRVYVDIRARYNRLWTMLQSRNKSPSFCTIHQIFIRYWSITCSAHQKINFRSVFIGLQLSFNWTKVSKKTNTVFKKNFDAGRPKCADEPEQALLHGALCCWSPWQSAPPLRGAGLEQVRVLCLCPHNELQSVHSLHDDQPPFTDNTTFYIKTS